MSTATDNDLQEIEELVSAIRELTREHLRGGRNTISEIRLRLDHLKDFLSGVVGCQDLLSVTDNFIQNTNSFVHYCPWNYNLSLKTNMCELAEQFENFKLSNNVYRYL